MNYRRYHISGEVAYVFATVAWKTEEMHIRRIMHRLKYEGWINRLIFPKCLLGYVESAWLLLLKSHLCYFTLQY